MPDYVDSHFPKPPIMDPFLLLKHYFTHGPGEELHWLSHPWEFADRMFTSGGNRRNIPLSLSRKRVNMNNASAVVPSPPDVSSRVLTPEEFIVHTSNMAQLPKRPQRPLSTLRVPRMRSSRRPQRRRYRTRGYKRRMYKPYKRRSRRPRRRRFRRRY